MLAGEVNVGHEGRELSMMQRHGELAQPGRAKRRSSCSIPFTCPHISLTNHHQPLATVLRHKGWNQSCSRQRKPFLLLFLDVRPVKQKVINKK